MINYTKEQIRVNRLIWEDAIASGDYKKGSNKLKQNNKFCCLGIAAELFAEENNVDIKKEVYRVSSFNGTISKANITYFNNEAIFAPKYVINALGLLSKGGKSKRIQDTTLAEINDTNKSFAPVLEAIETGNYYI